MEKFMSLIPEEMIEQSAISQISNVRSFPFLIAYRVMPDVHAGMTLPIGSVVIFDNVISSDCVGSDIACVDKDTEYLTNSGWKKINEYNNEEIMIFDFGENKASFEKPSRWIKEKCDEFYHIKTKYGIDKMVSSEHKIPYLMNNKIMDIRAEDLATKHNLLKLGFRGKFLTTFEPILNTSINMTDEQIRVQVMCSADGNFPSTTTYCRLTFHKERKIERAKKLLSDANIKFTHNINGKRNIILFNAPLKEKSLTIFWKCSLAQLNVIVDEIFNWDGYIGETKVFYSKNKENIDFVQYACACCGIRTSLITDVRKDGEIEYRIVCAEKSLIGIAGTPKTPIIKVKSEDGFKYCFTTSTGYWIMRRNGRIAITGNCGMCNITTDILSIDIIKDRWKLLAELQKKIPTGFEGRRYTDYLEFKSASGNKNLNNAVNAKIYTQIGTLGGGNHFLELGEDLDGFLTITIHSGSRNPGKTVQEFYSKFKQDGLPKAFFYFDSDIGQQYFQDMKFMEEFSYANRRMMMRDTLEVLGLEFNKYKDIMINIHHNHAENLGDNKILHRKGATPAHKDQLGIIPGNSRDGTYIVKGLGNEEWLESCSHGAGRVMSRGRAKREIDLDEYMEQMGDIAVPISPHTLDEAPGVYKDINYVIGLQTGIVISVINYIKPWVVLKDNTKGRKRRK